MLKSFTVGFALFAAGCSRPGPGAALRGRGQQRTVQHTADRQLFTDMQNRIFEFMNNRRWTNQCYTWRSASSAVFINLTEMPEIGIFRANVQVVSVRPAYGTGYESTLFSFIDKDWVFQFNNAQPLD